MRLLPQSVLRGDLLRLPTSRPTTLGAWTSLERPRGDGEGLEKKWRGRGKGKRVRGEENKG